MALSSEEEERALGQFVLLNQYKWPDGLAKPRGASSGPAAHNAACQKYAKDIIDVVGREKCVAAYNAAIGNPPADPSADPSPEPPTPPPVEDPPPAPPQDPPPTESE